MLVLQIFSSSTLKRKLILEDFELLGLKEWKVPVWSGYRDQIPKYISIIYKLFLLF